MLRHKQLFAKQTTIRDCDEIIVLQKKRVVQHGTHANLIEEDGYYKKLIQSY